MSARRLLASVASTSVVAASLALAAPALADPAFTPASTDVIGVGSDTSEVALNYLADGANGVAGYNAGRASGRLASYDATGSATIPLPDGTTPNRPNGSGAGKSALLNAAYAQVDFARSSSAISASEKSAGLFAFPFAKDTLALATAKTSNAPASITPAQMVAIYKCDPSARNWNQFGGSAGDIVPMIPQSGSGTRSFFEAQLAAANGGVAVNLGGSCIAAPVQEHDPAPVQGNVNAVAPFSVGRNAVAGSPLRIEGGFSAARALYNVVRQGDVAQADITSIFGSTGFVCSAAAKPLIAAAGFDQLLPPSKGGVCGVATQDPTTNLATEQVATTTTVAGSSKSAGALTAVATIAAPSGSPSGIVSFFVDGAAAGSAVVTGTSATRTISGLAAGNHTVVAKFVPGASSVFLPSDSAAAAVSVLATTPAPPVTTKAKTTLKETYKASYAKGAVVKAKIKVKESATGAAAGKVVIKRGTKTVGKGTVKNGVVTIKLKSLKAGKNKLVAKYAGSSAFAASKLTFTVTVKG